MSVPATVVGVERSAGAGFYRWHGGVGVRHVTLTGLHAGNGRVLATYEDGEKGQLQGYRDRSILRRLTPDEVQTYTALHTAHLAAEKAYNAFIAARELNPGQAVKDALAAAVDTPNEPSVDDESADPR